MSIHGWWHRNKLQVDSVLALFTLPTPHQLRPRLLLSLRHFCLSPALLITHYYHSPTAIIKSNIAVKDWVRLLKLWLILIRVLSLSYDPKSIKCDCITNIIFFVTNTFYVLPMIHNYYGNFIHPYNGLRTIYS